MPLIYNGTTITAVIYNGTSLSQLDYNGTTVWNSGTTMGCFYGGGDGTNNTNTVTRINSSGALVGSETTLGTIRTYMAGAGIDDTSVNFGGRDATPANINTITRINTSGTIIGSETTAGTARYDHGGDGVDTTAIFYGGYSTAVTNTVTRINSSGTLIGSETTAGTARRAAGGAGVNSTAVAIFWGGYSSTVDVELATCTRINTSGTIYGSETSVSTARTSAAACALNTTGVFYAGTSTTYSNYVYTYTNYNSVLRISTSGTIIGTLTSAGTARRWVQGGDIDDTTALFHGGYTTAAVSTTTRINESGAIIGSETSVGTALYFASGCGI